MSPEYMVRRRSDFHLTGPSVWLDENSAMPSTDLFTARGSPINTLLTHFFCTGRSASQSVLIVNKLSGKALEVENSSPNQGARIQQFTRNGTSNQRWFVKCTKFIKYRAFPGMIRHRMLRFWPPFLPLPQAGYSLIADHSGLCLDILNGSTDNAVAVQQLPLKRGNNQLWGFVADNEGFNFVINLHSGEVLEVAEIKNCTPVLQYPFNGGDNQRWQLFH
jgi:Ricin-type beta-trefoil lectin domain-like